MTLQTRKHSKQGRALSSPFTQPRSSWPGPRCWGPSLRLRLPPDARVLTSVCALGSPALAFSRTSSKGVSTSPFTGPLTREKRAECHEASSCHLSGVESTAGMGFGPGAASHVKMQVRGVRDDGERRPHKAPPHDGARTADSCGGPGPAAAQSLWWASREG